MNADSLRAYPRAVSALYNQQLLQRPRQRAVLKMKRSLFVHLFESR